jgi:putative transposase
VPTNEPEEILHVMQVIDRIYLEHPKCDSRLMTDMLYRDGFAVNRKRVRRLMKLIGLEAIYQKPNLSRKHPNNPIYPYLLGNLKINRSNEVWSSAITYVPIQGRCIYCCAIIDWSSRAALAW